MGLCEAGRMKELQCTADSLAIHALAIQESRAPSPGLRMMTSYFAVATGTGPTRANGTEIWIARNLPFCHWGTDVYAMPHMLTVVHTEPTMLAITLSLGGFRLGLITGQAPTAGKPKRVRAWWRRFHRICAAVVNVAPCTVLLMDANARIGSKRTQHVGGTHADPQDVGGEGLHTSLEILGAFLPQTFPEHFGQDTGYTWMSKQGRTSRNDYVGWPLASSDDAISAKVCYDVSISGGTIDHWMVMVEGDLLASGTAPLCRRRHVQYDRLKVLAPGHSQAIAVALGHAPRWPWRMNASDSSFLHGHVVRAVLALLCPTTPSGGARCGYRTLPLPLSGSDPR